MDDKDRKRVARWLNYWRRQLFLNEWTLHTEFVPSDNSHGPDFVLAEIDASPVYLEAHITIYPAFWRAPKKTQEHCIVHELVHCLTQESLDIMRKQAGGAMIPESLYMETIERLTQRVSNIAFRDNWGE